MSRYSEGFVRGLAKATLDNTSDCHIPMRVVRTGSEDEERPLAELVASAELVDRASVAR